MDQICSLTLTQASVEVGNRSVSPVELTRACLDRIQRLDSQFNSFIAVDSDQALAEANALERELLAGERRGPLHGIPVALKDLIDVEGMVTTAASELFLQNIARRDAEVVTRLKAAGAVIIGKTNLHEFAYGGSGMISYFGPVRNPVDPRYITGGSSSGSAAAVAAGFCYAAIGTDTAGSIRLPAAYCGVVGLKPTYGTVSADGVVPLAWSYDHVGPIARTVEDAAIVQCVLADNPLVDVPTEALRIGMARQYFFDGVDPEIATAVEKAFHSLVSQHGVLAVDDISIPVDEDRTVSNAEAYAYHLPFLAEGSERYQKETLRRVLSGEKVTAPAYIRKRRELDELRRRASEIFTKVDVVITPTVPISPSPIEELKANPAELRPRELMMLRNTRPFNVLGLPALTIPCGRTLEGLRIGLQLIAAPGREDVLIGVAKLVEKLNSN